MMRYKLICVLSPRCVLDLVMAQKDGKYLIVKDPNKPMIRFGVHHHYLLQQ